MASQNRPYEGREQRGLRASATRLAYLAIHGGQYASARVALIDPTEDDDEEDDLGGEHRRIVRESARYFCDDAGADLPVPHRVRLCEGRVGMSRPLIAVPISTVRTLTVTERKNWLVPQ